MYRTLPKGLRAPPDRAPSADSESRRRVALGCCRARHHLSTLAREDDTMSDHHQRSDGAVLHDRKLAAWAFAVGERPRRIERRPPPAASRHAAGRRFRPGGSRSRLPAAAVAHRRFPVGRPAPQSGTAGRRGRAAGSAHGRSRRTPRRGLYWGRRGWRRRDSRVDRGFARPDDASIQSRLRARRVRAARAFTSIEYQDNVPLV